MFTVFPLGVPAQLAIPVYPNISGGVPKAFA
jgi:hypothetical protein